MREENPAENRVKSSKLSDQNVKINSNFSKISMKSSWGLKGFSAAEKKPKTRVLQTSAQKNQPPLSRTKNAKQVHPQALQRTKSVASSEDLFLEIDHLRKLLQESKDRELSLQTEIKRSLDLEKQVELKRIENDELVGKLELLEKERGNLSRLLGKQDEALVVEGQNGLFTSSAEMEVVELRRLNMELQLQKRNLCGRISALESQLANFANVSESDNLEKMKEEAYNLRSKNQDLCKQVEGLQLSRMNEVEELAYLRWVNSCLRDELHVCSTTPKSIENSPFDVDEDDDSASKRLYLIKKFKKWPIADEEMKQVKNTDRRHSISGTNCSPEDLLLLNKKRQSDSFICSKEFDKRDLEVCKAVSVCLDVEKRALRVANPPPRPSFSGPKDGGPAAISPPLAPPPPPPPPPKSAARVAAGAVQRAPQVVEFYHSLMKRVSRKDCLNSGSADAADVANVRSSMIGEIENRSSHLLAIKADVETQGEFVKSLIREVNEAVYRDIDDVVAFVKWLDDELCFLVDERAVLKHFEWPEKKADTLREAAFGYKDLKRLEQEVSNYKDDPRLPCDIALKKMVALSDRMERTVHNILRTRDTLIRNCKEFLIPTDWMLDMGILSKIKLGSVKLAKMYIKRLASELEFKGTSEKDSSLDYMLLHGVRFAFRIHQFAGGFDAETMRVFEELRDLAVSVVLNKIEE